MNILSSPATYAPVAPAYATVGHKPVGLESIEGRKAVIKPVEEGAPAAKSALQPRKDEQTVLNPPDNLVTLSANSIIESKAATLSSGVSNDEQAVAQTESPKAALNSKITAGEEAAQREQIQSLAQRDREVRAHEQAHMAAGGAHAGAARYEYVRGPDGISYAVSGEVPIDMGPASTPQATLEKAQTLQRAALAPADPSSQDRNVAAAAAQLELQALQQINIERQQKRRELETADGTGNPTLKPEKKAYTALNLQLANVDHRKKDQADLAPSGSPRNPYGSVEPEAGRLLDTSV